MHAGAWPLLRITKASEISYLEMIRVAFEIRGVLEQYGAETATLIGHLLWSSL